MGVNGAAREVEGRWRTFLTMVVASTVPRCIACVRQEECQCADANGGGGMKASTCMR